MKAYCEPLKISCCSLVNESFNACFPKTMNDSETQSCLSRPGPSVVSDFPTTWVNGVIRTERNVFTVTAGEIGSDENMIITIRPRRETPRPTHSLF